MFSIRISVKKCHSIIPGQIEGEKRGQKLNFLLHICCAPRYKHTEKPATENLPKTMLGHGSRAENKKLGEQLNVGSD